jgi:uncharacterized protein
VKISRPKPDIDKMRSQEPVIALLSDPATFGTTDVKRIDTHAASVFLAGDRAIKIKRSVRFPFLDYSTLELRKAACEAELEVNRRFAPTIYRGVVAITREKDGSLTIGGTGSPVEWAVEMRRFDENATLDRLAERNEIDAALADALGRIVAAAHAASPVVDAEPWIGALASFIAQNDAAFRGTPQLFPSPQVDALTHASQQAFERIRPMLLVRGEKGLVRRGHGDLHLGNIVLLDGHPTLFDAVEFDPLIAAGDVLYDLAFLLMDLIDRGFTTPANIVFNRYLTETRRPEDLDALAAMPLFLSVRAAIRAKVTAARLTHAAAEMRPAIERWTQTYFRLAQRLIAPAPPRLTAVGGLSGTGKSQLAQGLAPELGPSPGAVVLRSDVERKALFERSETERLPSSAYTRDANTKVYTTLFEKARRAVTAGHAAIIDAVFASPKERAEVEMLAQVRTVTFRGIFLAAPLTTRLERLGKRISDASDADSEVARQQENLDLGNIEWPFVDASGSREDTLERAKEALV